MKLFFNHKKSKYSDIVCENHGVNVFLSKFGPHVRNHVTKKIDDEIRMVNRVEKKYVGIFYDKTQGILFFIC